MSAAVFPGAETWSELVNPLHAGGEKPFHLEFGRGAQKERSRFRGFDVLLGGRSKNPDRSFRFDESGCFKSAPERRCDLCTDRKGTLQRLQGFDAGGLSLC